MDRRVSRLVGALSSAMNPVQAEGFLHVTAFTRAKSIDTLAYEDWPALERAIRQALALSIPADRIDGVCEEMHRALLESCEASDA